MKNGTYYSNGKLLLTGEYVVLDGATSLAIPTKYGQSLAVESNNDKKIIWHSYDEKNTIWFKHEFELNSDGRLKKVQYDDISNKIVEILNAAKLLNPEFLNQKKGYNISTFLNFPRNWGLGTSSTLINILEVFFDNSTLTFSPYFKALSIKLFMHLLIKFLLPLKYILSFSSIDIFSLLYFIIICSINSLKLNNSSFSR